MTQSPLSVVVPAYNEEATLHEIVARLLVLPEVCQIVIVNDCSTDRTGEIADVLAKLHPKITVARHAANKGKTEALKTGFALTTGEIVIVQDADLEYDPAEICEVIAPIIEGDADVVYGSRFLVRKASRVLYFYHYLANKGLTFLSNLLTNLNMTDVETCYKAFRGEIIRNMRITSSGFGFEIEVTAKVAKLKGAIYEVPISYHGRTYEQGKKIGMKDGIAALWYIFWFNLFVSVESSFTTIPKLAGNRHYPDEKKPALHQRSSTSARVVICALLFFAGAASVFIPAIGIEEDEVLFAPAIYHPAESADSLNILSHQFPTMLMSYVGADKTYLYAAILRRVPPSAWSLRLPVVFMGVLTVWLLFVGVRRFTNEYVAAALACLIATDPVFMLTTTFDWGPVAVQHLLFVAALACFTRPKPFVLGGFLALGAALWDKGTAIWTLGAMAVSVALFLPGTLRAHFTRRNLTTAVCGFALGALPFLIFNFTHHWATFSENTIFTTEGVGRKVIAMYAAFDGRGMFGWLMRGTTPEWYTLVPYAFAASLILLFRKSVEAIRPTALFALFTGLLTWLAMLFVKNGGASLHHLLLVWPWPHLFLMCVLGFAFRKQIFLGIATALILSNVVMVGLYAQRTYAFGPGTGWSEASFGLPEILPRDRKIVTLDWGIHNTGTFLTRGRVVFEDRTFSGLTDADLPDLERTEFLTHVQAEEVIAGNNARFDAAIGKAGFVRVADRILSDHRGRALIVSFHCVRKPV